MPSTVIRLPDVPSSGAIALSGRIGAAHPHDPIDRQPDCRQPEHQRGMAFCQIGNQQGNAADTCHNQNHVDRAQNNTTANTC